MVTNAMIPTILLILSHVLLCASNEIDIETPRQLQQDKTSNRVRLGGLFWKDVTSNERVSYAFPAYTYPWIILSHSFPRRLAIEALTWDDRRMAVRFEWFSCSAGDNEDCAKATENEASAKFARTDFFRPYRFEYSDMLETGHHMIRATPVNRLLSFDIGDAIESYYQVVRIPQQSSRTTLRGREISLYDFRHFSSDYVTLNVGLIEKVVDGYFVFPMPAAIGETMSVELVGCTECTPYYYDITEDDVIDYTNTGFWTVHESIFRQDLLDEIVPQPPTEANDPNMILSDPPSTFPSKAPSDFPSMAPSDAPSMVPSNAPSPLPSDMPSVLPSIEFSDVPSFVPSDAPSVQPTH